MSDDKDTTIPMLPPRAKGAAKKPPRDLSRMMADHRADADPSGSAPTTVVEVPTVVVEPPEPRAAARRTPTRKKTSAQAKSPKPAMTSYVDAEVQRRAKAAYSATNYFEKDGSWSKFVERALLNEAKRREAEYNHGRPYEGGTEPLSPGRTVEA